MYGLLASDNVTAAAAGHASPGDADQTSSTRESAWRQWGGPRRNFTVEAPPLATAWRPEGPRRIWSRPLGDGHSTILVEDGRLYTMYRPPPQKPDAKWHDEEVVVALDESTGRTLWEHRYPAAPLDFQFGVGPHATPLIVGDRLFTSGTNKQIYAFDKRTGRVLWLHDLVKEYGSPPTLMRVPVKAGYSCSPIAYRGLVIVTAGGPGQGVMAFEQRTGALRWKSPHGEHISHVSPILISVGGQEQLVVVSGTDIFALNPETGELVWTHPHATRMDMNISTPVFGDDNRLLVSSAYDHGARMLQLTRTGAATAVRELWFSRRLRVHIGSIIRIGDFVYGSSGDFGPAFITALDARTGEMVWQDRQFARATFLHADDKLIILDEEGVLALATVSGAGLRVLARATILTSKAWSAPTMVGSTLYVRDRNTIAKLELDRLDDVKTAGRGGFK